jgi:flagellar protein FliO/FliZ
MTGSYSYLFIKSIVTLVFVLALLGVALYAFRYFMGRRSAPGLKKGLGSPIKVLTTSFIGQKKNLVIVDVAGELLVLGITSESITCLTKLERPEVVDELKRFGDTQRRPLFGLFR